MLVYNIMDTYVNGDCMCVFTDSCMLIQGGSLLQELGNTPCLPGTYCFLGHSFQLLSSESIALHVFVNSLFF